MFCIWIIHLSILIRKDSCCIDNGFCFYLKFFAVESYLLPDATNFSICLHQSFHTHIIDYNMRHDQRQSLQGESPVLHHQIVHHDINAATQAILVKGWRQCKCFFFI